MFYNSSYNGKPLSYIDQDTESHILFILEAIFIAPIMEEPLFRGLVLNRLLSKMKVWPAILISALLFAIAHFNFIQGIYCFIMGIALGYVFVKTRSLIPCMIGHGLINLKSALPLNGTGLFYILFHLFVILAIYSIVKLEKSENPKLELCKNKQLKV